MTTHIVKLSNGRELQIEEGNENLSIALRHMGDVDAYICSLDGNGVLVYCNSGDATGFLTQGLKKESE